jgi:heat-inducible transcriptional repressor
MLTSRQSNILASIIESYSEVASPVGSITLAKLFNVSPATIRTEMSELEHFGYISQPHTSAGRIPTDKGYRHYVNNLTDQINLKPMKSSHPGVHRAITSSLSTAGLPERAIKNAVDILVNITGNLGIATIGDQLYISGLSNLFSQPELLDPRSIKEVASLLDNLEPWLKEVAPNEALSVYIGQENPIGRSSGCTLIISKFISPFSDNSYIGLIGSTRQNYAEVISLVQSTGLMLAELFQ